MQEEPVGHGVLVFDGVCNLCNGLVNFIIKREPGDYFRFVSLQAEKGQDLLKGCGLSTGRKNKN